MPDDVKPPRGRPGQPGNVPANAFRGSGNPGGRPSYAKALAANGTNSADLLAKLVKKAVAWLDDKADSKRAEYAHMWLTERVLRIARPKETMDLNVGGPSPEQTALLEALKLTPHERRKAIAQATDDVDVPPIDTVHVDD